MSKTTKFKSAPNHMTVFSELFDQIRIANLPERTDRKKEVVQQLKRIGIDVDGQRVRFFPAVRPHEKGGFPSIGAHGCFMSHLRILQEAQSDGIDTLLVLEDDVNFTPDFQSRVEEVASVLSNAQWDMCYLGHVLELPDEDSAFVEYRGPIVTAHTYAVRKEMISRLTHFLEIVLSREPGHPLGGPMHVDGAFSTFRQQNADVKTLVVVKPLTYQRPSRTDIHKLRLYDRLPLVRQQVSLLRRVRSRFLEYSKRG